MMKQTANPDFFQLAFGDGTPKKALMTAILGGTILTLINHGDVILRGESLNYLKIILTYLGYWNTILDMRQDCFSFLNV